MSKRLTFVVLSAALLSAAHAAPQAIASCSADKIKAAMASCDSVVNISQIKCDTTACHKALHLLVDPDYIACYEELKMGSENDLAKYKVLDDFCHGEGPDPLEAEPKANANGNGTTAGASAAAEKNESVAAKASTVPSPSPTPSSGAATVACSSAATLAIAVAALV